MSKIYGIDLGTSYSVLGKGDKLLTGLVPSVANMATKQAGITQKENFKDDVLRSFKINMSMGAEGKASIAASALVLKELAIQAKEDVKDVVISVPAYFTDNERKATVEAAKIAGMNVVSLINEPTAAALYYNKNNPCLSAVFDLGGGTFDVSVIDSRLDFNDVVATDGCILGGDNFDRALLKYILKVSGIKLFKSSTDLIPIIKSMCEKAKLRIQQTGKTVEVDLSVYRAYLPKDSQTSFPISVDVYKEIMQSVFKKCVILTKRVLEKSINYGDIYKFIFVGGSTRCPYLREWVEKELEVKAEEITYDQDKIVAQGAMYYAQLVEKGEAASKVSDVTKALGIEEVGGFIRNVIPNDTKLPVTKTILVNNAKDSDGIFLNLYQGESARVENATCIGSLDYEFGEMKEAGTGTLKVTLKVDIAGIITLSAKDLGKLEKSIQLKVK